MKKKKNKIGKILVSVLVSVVTIFAMAVAPVNKVFADGDTYFDWGCPTDQGSTTITCILMKIIGWMSIGVTIAVIGGIIYGAIMYTSAGGKADQAKKGMKIIQGAAIALVLYFAMYALLNFIIPGGTTP